MRIDRRTAVAGMAATLGGLAARPAAAAAPAGGTRRFPRGFLWGAATAGHQIEGNNVASDMWVLEHVKPTIFAEPSGDALNGFDLWETDLDLAKSLNLNSYRFSIEWPRIEPEQGAFSLAMLDHYKRVAAGCRKRGMTPVVTFNHFTNPRWFAAAGGWANPQAPALFARFCERATRAMGADIGYAVTLNEPNVPYLMQGVFPAAMLQVQEKMLAAAAKAVGSERFSTLMAFPPAEYAAISANLLAAHKAARDAIKSAAPHLPVGVSLALSDEQAVGENSIRDRMRSERYGAWMEAAKADDFIAVQNYSRSQWDAKGPVQSPPGGKRNYMGTEVYAPSLAGAVRYAHEATGKPVLITEHGVGTDDDTLRAWLIPAALRELQAAVAGGVPVIGYIHWSLIDNYEWIFGYKPKFGLASVDRTTFRRTPKPSAHVLARIARANAVTGG